MSKKLLSFTILSSLLLAGCGAEEIHVSRPKETIYKNYEDGEYYSQKIEYEYDKKGNQTYIKYYSYDDSSKQYILSRDHAYTYDKKGNITSSISSSYYSGKKEFYSKVIYTYDNDLLVREDYYGINGNGQEYIDLYYSDYVYDDLNRNTSFNEYQFDDSINDYVLMSSTRYTYKESFETFVTCKSENHTSIAYLNTYIERDLDEDGKIIYSIASALDFIQAEFYTYTEFGEVASVGTYTVDEETGKYHLVSTYDYLYINKHYVSEISSTYFDDQGDVRMFLFEKNVYDKKMNILSNNEYELNFETDELVLCSETINSY